MPEISTLGIPMAKAIQPDAWRYIADEAISALRVVRLAAPGHVVYARPSEIEARAPIGVTLVSAVTDEELTVRDRGELTSLGWTWTPGPVLLGPTGTLTQTQPTGQAYLVVIGQAVYSTTIIINIQPAIILP